MLIQKPCSIHLTRIVDTLKVSSLTAKAGDGKKDIAAPGIRASPNHRAYADSRNLALFNGRVLVVNAVIQKTSLHIQEFEDNVNTQRFENPEWHAQVNKFVMEPFPPLEMCSSPTQFRMT